MRFRRLITLITLYQGFLFLSCSARSNVVGESVSPKKIANTATLSSVMPKCWVLVCISAIFLGESRYSSAFSSHFNWFLKQVYIFVADKSNLNSVRSAFSDRNAKITNAILRLRNTGKLTGKTCTLTWPDIKRPWSWNGHDPCSRACRIRRL